MSVNNGVMYCKCGYYGFEKLRFKSLNLKINYVFLVKTPHVPLMSINSRIFVGLIVDITQYSRQQCEIKSIYL